MASPSKIEVQLVLIRSLIDRARLSLGDGTDVGCMTAMLLADVAAETLSKVACRERSIPPPKSDGLNEYLNALSDAVPSLKNAPELAAVRSLRRTRNTVQHDGLIPAKSTAAIAVDDSEAFIQFAVREIFGIDFGSTSVVSLVRPGQIRTLLEEARRLKDSNLRGAHLHAAAAFELMRTRWYRTVALAHGYDPSLESRMPLTYALLLADFGIQEFAPSVADDQYTVFARMMMGFTAPELATLDSFVKKAYLVRDGESADVKIDDVQRAIELVARQAWRLEATNPESLADPPSPGID